MSPSILIIKEPKPSQELRTALHSEGYSVREAHNAADGMRSFLHNSPDLVLLDLSLDGMQLLRDMKNARGSVPIIALSQYSSVNDAVSAFKAGAWDYITTPIANMQVFINSLRNCLSQSRLRKRVQESQQHLFLLIQNLPVIIFIINRNLEFEFLSQATERILGYTHQEILQSPKSFLRCIVPEDRKKFLNGLRLAMHAEGQQRRLDFRFRHKKGYQVFLQAQSIIRPERNIALPEYLEGMLLDVTRSTYMDSLLHQNEKLEMLRSMTEDVAHEIRNPLVSLGGYARQLRAKFPQTLETEVILKECARLERLLQRMNAYLEPLHIEQTLRSLRRSGFRHSPASQQTGTQGHTIRYQWRLRPGLRGSGVFTPRLHLHSGICGNHPTTARNSGYSKRAVSGSGLCNRDLHPGCGHSCR